MRGEEQSISTDEGDGEQFAGVVEELCDGVAVRALGGGVGSDGGEEGFGGAA